MPVTLNFDSDAPTYLCEPRRLTEHIIISLWSTDVTDEFLETRHPFKNINTLLLTSAT